MNYQNMSHKEIRKILREKQPNKPDRGEGGIISMSKEELIAEIKASKKPKPLTFETAPEVLTPLQVQSLLQISRSTFFRLVESDQIAGATKIGGSWRVWRNTLLESLTSKR